MAMRYNTISMSGKRSNPDQRGIMSFTVTLIMMIVISLIVIGFAEVANRNRRQALDRQLAAQAFYAAESGINVTSAIIKNYVNANGSSGLALKKGCANNYSPNALPGTPIADLSDGVRYTCVLVNPRPPTLIYDVNQGQSTIVPISTYNKSLGELKFEWHKQTGSVDTSCAGANEYAFPAQSAWTCGFGVIRVELVGLPAAATKSSDMTNNIRIVYLTPKGGGGGEVTLGGDKVYVAPGSCNSSTCSVTIKNVGGYTDYYARLTSVYRDAPKTTISGTLTTGETASFYHSQAVVDVTGQAQDELRRIQVRLSLANTASTTDVPYYAVSSQNDICKHFSMDLTDNVIATALCR